MKKKSPSISLLLQKNWKLYLSLVTLSFAIIFIVFFKDNNNTTICEKAKYSISTPSGKTKLYLEEASTPSSIEKGLMFREKLDESHGMLFIFPKPMQLSMWMRNTSIPLDMLFLNENFIVHKIHANAKPHDDTLILSDQPTKYVLELNAGEATKYNITVGSILSKD